MKCEHSYKPLNYKQLKPELYLIRWKCEKCGKIHVFKTSTDWRNLEDEQGGRTFYNSEKGRN